MTQRNQTGVTEFILLGFSDLSPQLQLVLFVLFLVIYLLTLMGNLLIITLVMSDHLLQTPMYIFLRNLSVLEIFYSTITVPKLLQNLLSEEKRISFFGCATQLYFFAILGVSESYLLALMAYDRQVAICKPLHHVSIVNKRFCLQAVASSFLIGVLSASLQVGLIFSLPYCGPNKISHFFCDAPPLLKLVCSDTAMTQLEISISSIFILVGPFSLVLTSYVCIVAAVLRMRSIAGRRKAFSTCASHLTSVTLFYGTATCTYLLPKAGDSQGSSLALSLFYSVFTPMLNPLIYSLRNKEMMQAMRRLIRRKIAQRWGLF